MRRSRATAAAVFAVVTVAGCGPLRQQVEDVAGTVEYCAQAVEVAQAVRDRNLEQGLAAADDLASSAPDDIRPEVETVREALQTAQGGDATALADPEVQQAAIRIEEFSRRECDPTS